MIITIDGPSGTGKSTVSKMLADQLGFEHLDTGAFYRAFALHVLRNKASETDDKQLQGLLHTFDFQISRSKELFLYKLSGDDITSQIRSPEISQLSSKISTYDFVRKEIVSRQRAYAGTRNIVAEGRDLGTVVFPKAEVKFFLTADKNIRAERRYQELLSQRKIEKDKVLLADVLREINERDDRDSNRSLSPLACPEDACIIDTSSLSTNQVVEQLLTVFKSRTEVKRTLSSFLKRSFYFFVIQGLKIFFKLLYGLKVYGKENVHEAGGIVASNHTSFFDPPILAASTPVEVHFLAKDYLFKVPFLKTLICLLNAHPLKGSASDVGVFKTIQSLILEDKKVVIFPEGSRSRTGQLLALKKGVATIALRTGSKIYPTYIDGAHHIWSREKKFPRLFGKLRVVFGQPLSAAKYVMLDKKEAQQKFTEELQFKLVSLESWIKNGAKGNIP